MVEVYTDYKNLISTKVLNQRQVRQSEEFVSYNFRIQYRKGLENRRANALNRRNNYFDEQAEKQTRLILIINNDGYIRYNYADKSLLGIIKIAWFKSKGRLQRTKLTTTLRINNIDITDELKKAVSEDSFIKKLIK